MKKEIEEIKEKKMTDKPLSLKREGRMKTNKIKHKCEKCAEWSKRYAERSKDYAKWSKDYAELSKKHAELSKKYADKCRCEEWKEQKKKQMKE